MSGRRPDFDLEMAGPPVPPGSCTVAAIEVTQAIQSLAHDVSLIAGKATVVRVYLDRPEAEIVTVRGEIEVASNGEAPVTVPSMNTLALDTATNGTTNEKRLNLDGSLNFRLPDSLTVPGNCTFRVRSVRVAEIGEEVELAAAVPTLSLTFIETPPLRVRLVSFRYEKGTPPKEYEPSALDLSLIESWLRRAYPVPQVIATRITVQGTKLWPGDATSVNVRLTAMRNADMAAGGDPLTHYYGLVADAGGAGFMRGLASAIPGQPDPSAVASGPTGGRMYPWDTDGSYGDWYTGHELAHTFGRRHLGSGCGDGPKDPAYPHPRGQLSGPDNQFVGFDVGDPALGLPMAVYPGTDYHDVMCYCKLIWISAFTYMAIRDWIEAEAAPAAGPLAIAAAGFESLSTMDAEADMATWLNVVGMVNFTRSTGHIEVMQQVESAKPPAGEETRARIELYDKLDQLLQSLPARVKLDACIEEGEEETGVLDTFVPLDDALERIDLKVMGKVVETRRRTSGGIGFDSLALAGGGPGGEEKYIVQVSTDDGATWQTVDVGADTADINVRWRDFPGAQRLRARVIGTDGFTSRVVREEEIT